MNLPAILLTATAGAAAGPWLRAVIFRHSVAYGRPRRIKCPRCRHPVGSGWQRRLPVTGRCPNCSRRLGAPALAVETTAAVVLALIAWRATGPALLILLSALAVAGLVLSFVDISVHRLPDPLVLATAAGIAATILTTAVATPHWHQISTAALSAAVCGGFYLVLAIFLPGIGLGDVKWAAVLALACGWFGLRTAIAGLAAGILIAALSALILIALRRAHRKTALPLGPSLSAGALAALTLHDM